MVSQLVVVVILIPLDCCLLDRPVHAFHLIVGPGMVWFGQPVFDSIGVADHVETVDPQASRPAIPVPRLIGKLDAIIGQDRMERVGNCLQNCFDKEYGSRPVGLLVKPDNGKFRCAPLGDCCAITCRAMDQWQRTGRVYLL